MFSGYTLGADVGNLSVVVVEGVVVD